MTNPIVYRRVIGPGGTPEVVVEIGDPITGDLNKWSVMHFAQPFWVPLSAAPITESDQNMFLGTYAGYDYA